VVSAGRICTSWAADYQRHAFRSSIAQPQSELAALYVIFDEIRRNVGVLEHPFVALETVASFTPLPRRTELRRHASSARTVAALDAPYRPR